MLCFIRYQHHCFIPPIPEYFVCVLGCAFHPMWLQFLVKISWAMKGWPTCLWIAFFLYDVSPSGANSIHRSENDSYQHILEVCQCAQRKRWTSDCSKWSLKYGFPVKGWLKGKQRIIRKLGDALAVVSVWGFFYITFSDKHQISRSLMTLLNCCVKFG